jgi:hypothetical protein
MRKLIEHITKNISASAAAALQLAGGLAASPAALSVITLYLLIQQTVSSGRSL